MSYKRKKREYLNRTDHRLDLSPAGRNLFVSRDKQAESRSARRIEIWMRVVLVLVIIGVSLVALIMAGFYLVPWFREELQLTSSGPVSALSGEDLPDEEEPIVLTDEDGLPILSDDVTLFIINSFSAAPADFTVETALVGTVAVDARAADAVEALMAAAKEDGLALVFTQGYTDYAAQEKRFNAAVEALMKEKDMTTVMARAETALIEPEPGESDFQTGLCLRVTGNPATFEDTRTYSWLKANMGAYGFVFRYPAYKEQNTGVTADLTVIRYVGKANAQAMQQRGLCLEEYVDYLNSQ